MTNSGAFKSQCRVAILRKIRLVKLFQIGTKPPNEISIVRDGSCFFSPKFEGVY